MLQDRSASFLREKHDEIWEGTCGGEREGGGGRREGERGLLARFRGGKGGGEREAVFTFGRWGQGLL